MNEDDTLRNLTDEYRNNCRKLDDLADLVAHDNANAQIVYEQCHIGLQQIQERIDLYLQALQLADHEDKAYYLRATRQALQQFNDLLKDAEIKLHDIRPIPPFLY